MEKLNAITNGGVPAVSQPLSVALIEIAARADITPAIKDVPRQITGTAVRPMPGGEGDDDPGEARHGGGTAKARADKRRRRTGEETPSLLLLAPETRPDTALGRTTGTMGMTGSAGGPYKFPGEPAITLRAAAAARRAKPTNKAAPVMAGAAALHPGTGGLPSVRGAGESEGAWRRPAEKIPALPVPDDATLTTAEAMNLPAAPVYGAVTAATAEAGKGEAQLSARSQPWPPASVPQERPLTVGSQLVYRFTHWRSGSQVNIVVRPGDPYTAPELIASSEWVRLRLQEHLPTAPRCNLRDEEHGQPQQRQRQQQEDEE